MRPRRIRYVQKQVFCAIRYYVTPFKFLPFQAPRSLKMYILGPRAASKQARLGSQAWPKTDGRATLSLESSVLQMPQTGDSDACLAPRSVRAQLSQALQTEGRKVAKWLLRKKGRRRELEKEELYCNRDRSMSVH